MVNHDLLNAIKRDYEVSIKFPEWHAGILFKHIFSIKIVKFIFTNWLFFYKVYLKLRTIG